MKINLWKCELMGQWRWTVIEDSRTVIQQESGQHKDLHIAMQDIEKSVEYLTDKFSKK